jgi:small multidrug resistance pump
MGDFRFGGLLANSLFLAALLALSHGILKWVSVNGGQTLVGMLSRYWYFVVLALAIYGFVFFYYLLALKRFNLASLYSIYTGLAVLLVVLISLIFFEESLSKAQMLGCALIALGVALVGKV